MRSDHAAAIFLLELGDAADMIVMVVGDQNIRQVPALAVQRRDHGAGFRRVDRGGRLGFVIVNEIAEIVGQAGEGTNFGGHDISSERNSARRADFTPYRYGVNAGGAMQYSARRAGPRHVRLSS